MVVDIIVQFTIELQSLNVFYQRQMGEWRIVGNHDEWASPD